MDDKLSLEACEGLAKPGARPERARVLDDAADDAGAPQRRIIPLGRHWALAVNRKLLGALGLALLVWAFIAALATLF